MNAQLKLSDWKDITASKHKGNENSKRAHKKIIAIKGTLRGEVLDIIESHPGGITAKEIAKLLERPLHSISGRISELKALGLVVPKGENREGSAVLILG